MPDRPKSTCAHCGESIIFAPDWVDSTGESDPNGWRHLQEDRPGAVACATRPDGWESGEWPKASPNKWVKRVTVRIDFADGTSNEIAAEDPTDHQWSIAHDHPMKVMERNGTDWVVARTVLPRRLDLQVAWEEESDDGH